MESIFFTANLEKLFSKIHTEIDVLTKITKKLVFFHFFFIFLSFFRLFGHFAYPLPG